MADLTETATYEPNIHELAVDEEVLGGPGGPANTQAQQLANRTKFLKAQHDYIEPLTLVAAFPLLR